MKKNRHREPTLKQQGLLLLRSGRLPEAYDAFTRLCAKDGTDPEGWYHLGIINAQLGMLDRVEPCLRRALTLDPDFSDAALRLGETLAYFGKLAESIEILQRLVARRPRLDQAWIRLGNMLEVTGRHEDAIQCYRRVIALNPRHDIALTSVGNAQYFMGDIEHAIEAYNRALEINPASLRALLGSYLSLPLIYRDRAHMLDARRRYDEGLEMLATRAELFKQSSSLIDDLQWSYNFYLAYQGMDDKPLQQAFGGFFTMMVHHALPRFTTPLPRTPVQGRRLRVGYVSHFFHDHTVSYYFNNWILNSDRDRIETYVYHINPVSDATSRALAAGCTRYRPLAHAIAGIAEVIRNDQLDILVYPEIGMYSKVMWLAALRLAPVQCVAWGHPVTSGLASIDYALSADATEPDDAEAHYTEALVRLPGMGACLRPAGLAQAGTREQYGLPPDRTLYLCSQSLFKIHVDMDEIMVALAEKDPRALIVLFEDYKPLVNVAYQQRIGAAFARRGLAVNDHLRFLPRMQHADFLRINQLADVMLDTPHWSGGRTSLDALSVGLPIVTQPGRYSRARQTSGMLELAGLTELIVPDIDAYVSKVIEIGSNQQRRKDLSERVIASSRSALFDNDSAIKYLEQSFMQMTAV